MLAGVPALLCRFPRRRAQEIRQASQVLLALQHERVGLLVGEHVLAECGAEPGEPLDDRSESLLAAAVESGAGALKTNVVAVENTPLLGIEPERIKLAV